MPQHPLERYTMLRELGRGAIGAVYTARDGSTGAAVALKILDPALFSHPDANLAELFLKNARSAARLRHRNIVKVHDAGEAGGTAYVAMELLEGESLRNMLDQAPLSIARAIQIFDDMASALAYAHEEGMVHRGIKPSNIIVLRSGVAKIGDFGIGQIGEAALRYKSPEQVRGDPVDHRSDLFSLGAVFYEMLTRRAAFEGNSPEEIGANVLHAKPPRPSELNPHVPAALDGIVFRLLAANPDERFANARIVLRELQRLEEALGLGPGASAPTDVPSARVSPGEAVLTLRTPATTQSLRDDAPIQDAPRFTALDEHDARFITDRESRRERSSGSRAAILGALAVMLAALAIGVLLYSPDALFYLSGLLEPRNPASRVQEAPATAAAPSPPPALLPVAEAIKEPVPAAAAPEPIPASRQEGPRAAQPTANIPAPQPGGTARLLLAISPQGELYIDDKHYGTTPPITTLDLEPGMHRIEIRSRSRKPYLTYMTLQAGDQRRIRHDFDAKPIRPPS